MIQKLIDVALNQFQLIQLRALAALARFQALRLRLSCRAFTKLLENRLRFLVHTASTFKFAVRLLEELNLRSLLLHLIYRFFQQLHSVAVLFSQLAQLLENVLVVLA